MHTGGNGGLHVAASEDEQLATAMAQSLAEVTQQTAAGVTQPSGIDPDLERAMSLSLADQGGGGGGGGGCSGGAAGGTGLTGGAGGGRGTEKASDPSGLGLITEVVQVVNLRLNGTL